MISKSAAFTLCLALSLSAAQPQYRLLVATKEGKIAERIADVLEKKLTGVEIQPVKQRERYARMPHLAMPVCSAMEYYLFSPAEDLLAVGCIEAEFPGLAAHTIAKAVGTYEAEVRAGGNPTVLSRGIRR